MPNTTELPRGAALVACDGRKLIILVNEGGAERPELRLDCECHRDQAPSRDLGTDRPGRVHPAEGMAKSAVAAEDRHDQEERQFLRFVASELESAVSTGRLGQIVLAAPPRALGALRYYLSDRVRAAVRQELAAELVDEPVGRLEARFARSH